MPWSMHLGNPLGFLQTAGQAHDLPGADALLPQDAGRHLFADKAFDADERVIERPLAAGKTIRDPAPQQSQGPALRFRQGISTKRAT